MMKYLLSYITKTGKRSHATKSFYINACNMRHAEMIAKSFIDTRPDIMQYCIEPMDTDLSLTLGHDNMFLIPQTS